jgi:carbamoyl-phosphate synthase large subunit
MEHVERAGVHSGDSMAIYPGVTLTSEEVDLITDYTVRIARNLGVKGLMNIQFVVMGGGHYRSPASPGEDHPADVYVLEVNPRASRTIPFISKVTGVPMVRLATKVMLGHTLKELGYETGLWPRQKLVAVKAPVFSMSKLAGVDTHLGPEMKSTGEVMGVDYAYPAAMAKALIASNMLLKPDGAVLVSIADKDKDDAVTLIKALAETGHKLYATEGTTRFIRSLGVTDVTQVSKLLEGSPNVVDVVQQGLVDAVINTLSGGQEQPMRDGFYIRRAAVERRIPCFTSLDTARTALEALSDGGAQYTIQPHQDYLVKTES